MRNNLISITLRHPFDLLSLRNYELVKDFSGVIPNTRIGWAANYEERDRGN
jgi:hypothetical protein